MTGYRYGKNDRLEKEILPDTTEVLYQYDENGNTLTETVHTDAGTLTTSYTYNDRNQVLTTTDPDGHLSQNRYDGKGNLVSATDPEGHTLFYAYDGNGNLRAMTDANGNETAYTYDAAGNMLSEEDPLANRTEYRYDNFGNKRSETVWRTVGGVYTELTTMYEYDYKNRVIKTTYPDETFTEMEYDEKTGKKSKEIAQRKTGDPEIATLYEYHGDGELKAIYYPDGTSETFDYADGIGDDEGYRKIVTDRAGIVTTFVHDKAGRLVKTLFADGHYTESEYNEAGEMTASVDPRGNRTEYEYDAAGREILTRNVIPDDDDIGTTFEYDANGNMVAMTDGLTHVTEYVYDDANRRVKTIFTKDDGSQIETSVDYDGAGRKVLETDLNGRSVKYGYDAAGRLETVTQYLDGREIVTTYGYDEAGNKISQLNPNNDTPVTWAYDRMGRVKTHTLPEGMSESFEYYSDGKVQIHTDFNNDTTTFVYGPYRERLMTKRYQDGTSVSFTYTDGGKRDTVTDARGVTDYDYDPQRGWLVKVTHPDESVISYGYDEAGNRTSVETPSGETVYGYDALNRLETVTEPDGMSQTEYVYDAVGNRKMVKYPNGTETEYFYDAMNRLTRIENRKADGTVFSAYEYDLDDSGNREFLAEYENGSVVRTVDYVYDDLYRLTGELAYAADGSSERAVLYTYDDFGNRMSKTDADGETEYRYDLNDRLYKEILPDSTEVIYQYDDNGNTLYRTHGSETIDYAYDFENRLIYVNNENGATDYEYDVDGIRVRSENNGVVTNYLVDKNRDYAQVLAEYDDSGSVAVSYVYGDDLIRQDRTDAKSYYHYDGQFSTRQLTDESGAVTDTYVFDAFGEPAGSTGSTENDYLYTGEQYDPNMGFYYLRARYYSPEVGRFVSSDPWQGNMNEPVTLHKYLYANINPIIYYDPSGLAFSSLSEVQQSMVIGAVLSEAGYLASTMVFSMLHPKKTFWDLFSFTDAIVAPILGAAGGYIALKITISPTANILEKAVGGVYNVTANMLVTAIVNYPARKYIKGQDYNANHEGMIDLLCGAIASGLSLKGISSSSPYAFLASFVVRGIATSTAGNSVYLIEDLMTGYIPERGKKIRMLKEDQLNGN